MLTALLLPNIMEKNRGRTLTPVSKDPSGEPFSGYNDASLQLLHLLGGVREGWLGSWNFHHPPVGTSPPASDIIRHPLCPAPPGWCQWRPGVESRRPLCPAVTRHPSPIQGVHGGIVGNLDFHPCQAVARQYPFSPLTQCLRKPAKIGLK